MTDRSGFTDIILVNYSNAPDTIECLESLLSMRCASPYRIIVVDNASPDDSWQILRNWAAPLSAIFLKEDDAPTSPPETKLLFILAKDNRGFAAGNNIGLRIGIRQGTGYFWLLNNDTTIAPDALEAQLEFLASHAAKKFGVVGAKLFFYHDAKRMQGVWGVYSPWTGIGGAWGAGQFDAGQYDAAQPEADTSYVIGASMFLARAFLLEVGMLSEAYFLYFEELDWAMRARERGWRVGFCPRCIVYHKFGQSIGSSASLSGRSQLADYYSIRNRLLITRRYFPRCLPTVIAGLLWTFLRRLLRGHLNLAFITLPRAVLAGFRMPLPAAPADETRA